MILGSPSHVVIGIVSQLEYVWWERNPGGCRVAVLGGILVEDRIGVARDVFVRVDSNKTRGTNIGVDGVGHKAFTETCYDNIIGNGGESCQVVNGLEPTQAHRHRRLPIHGGQTSDGKDDARIEEKEGVMR